MGEVSIKPKLELYQNARSASGSKVKISGDRVSKMLAGMTLDEVKQVAAAVVKKFDPNKYKGLNLGHQRMCIGNLIRGAVKDPETFNEAAFKTIREKADARIAKENETRAKAEAEKKAKREAKAAEAAKRKAARKEEAKSKTVPGSKGKPAEKSAPQTAHR